MKRFVFQLEAVRRIREQEEQLVQVELASALKMRAGILRKLECSQAAEQELYSYLRSSQLSSIELVHISRFDDLHRQRIFDMNIQLRNCDAAVERVRARLVSARARRESLDRLKDRRREQHRLAWLAEESHELDEIGTQSWQRQRAAGSLEVTV